MEAARYFRIGRAKLRKLIDEKIFLTHSNRPKQGHLKR